MQLSNIKVEQITSSYAVVEDYGEILTRAEMVDLFEKHFSNIECKNGCMYGWYNDKPYCIYFKNISYLGTPHPYFKKRIQIGDNFKQVFADNQSKGITTLLMGVYKYKETVLFVDFDVTKYATRKSHNSSAHVYTIDLKNGLLFGIFQKEDFNKNIITVFNTDNVTRYLQSKLEKGVDLRLDFIAFLDEFFAHIPKDWHGAKCYTEMHDAGFNNALQPEWPGFYLEYRLQRFIKEQNASHVVKYSQNKRRGEIDLDLYFPQVECYGDLKAHSNDSSGIQGNDWDTIMSVIDTSSIYYIVCNHDTEKDKDHDNEVTVLWNTLLGKSNLLSYAAKMKHSVHLTSYFVLEINRFNKQYLDVFHQGHNSDGSPRAPKITIKKQNISNFLIHQTNF